MVEREARQTTPTQLPVYTDGWHVIYHACSLWPGRLVHVYASTCIQLQALCDSAIAPIPIQPAGTSIHAVRDPSSARTGQMATLNLLHA